VFISLQRSQGRFGGTVQIMCGTDIDGYYDMYDVDVSAAYFRNS
jgi:hypothetical protein